MFKINTLITNNMKRMYNIMIVNIHFKVDVFFLFKRKNVEVASTLQTHELSLVITHFFTDLPYVWFEGRSPETLQAFRRLRSCARRWKKNLKYSVLCFPNS